VSCIAVYLLSALAAGLRTVAFLSRAWFGSVRAGGSCTAVSRQHQFVLREKAAGKVRCELSGLCPL
jgi:hypothetical protein